jgi:hypothetical protein
MSFQPVLPYPVGEGVNFFLRPNIPVIFKQDVPVGIGVNKTSIFSGRPWRFGLQFWSYVEAPDAFGPVWPLYRWMGLPAF